MTDPSLDREREQILLQQNEALLRSYYSALALSTQTAHNPGGPVSHSRSSSTALATAASPASTSAEIELEWLVRQLSGENEKLQSDLVDAKQKLRQSLALLRRFAEDHRLSLVHFDSRSDNPANTDTVATGSVLDDVARQATLALSGDTSQDSGNNGIGMMKRGHSTTSQLMPTSQPIAALTLHALQSTPALPPFPSRELAVANDIRDNYASLHAAYSKILRQYSVFQNQAQKREKAVAEERSQLLLELNKKERLAVDLKSELETVKKWAHEEVCHRREQKAKWLAEKNTMMLLIDSLKARCDISGNGVLPSTPVAAPGLRDSSLLEQLGLLKKENDRLHEALAHYGVAADGEDGGKWRELYDATRVQLDNQIKINKKIKRLLAQAATYGVPNQSVAITAVPSDAMDVQQQQNLYQSVPNAATSIFDRPTESMSETSLPAAEIVTMNVSTISLPSVSLNRIPTQPPPIVNKEAVKNHIQLIDMYNTALSTISKLQSENARLKWLAPEDKPKDNRSAHVDQEKLSQHVSSASDGTVALLIEERDAWKENTRRLERELWALRDTIQTATPAPNAPVNVEPDNDAETQTTTRHGGDDGDTVPEQETRETNVNDAQTPNTSQDQASQEKQKILDLQLAHRPPIATYLFPLFASSSSYKDPQGYIKDFICCPRCVHQKYTEL
jgi:hypothetical protein